MSNGKPPKKRLYRLPPARLNSPDTKVAPKAPLLLQSPKPERVSPELKAPRDTDKHPARKANSGSFKPGVSGNPKGRPRGARNLSHLVPQLLGTPRLRMKTEKGEELVSPAHAALLKVTEMGLKQGQLSALKMILDRFEKYPVRGEDGGEDVEPTASKGSGNPPSPPGADAILDWYAKQILKRNEEGN